MAWNGFKMLKVRSANLARGDRDLTSRRIHHGIPANYIPCAGVFVPAIGQGPLGSFLAFWLSYWVFSRIFAMAFWLKIEDSRYQTQCAPKLYFSGRLILSRMIFGMIRSWSFLSHMHYWIHPKIGALVHLRGEWGARRDGGKMLERGPNGTFKLKCQKWQTPTALLIQLKKHVRDHKHILPKQIYHQSAPITLELLIKWLT